MGERGPPPGFIPHHHIQQRPPLLRPLAHFYPGFPLYNGQPGFHFPPVPVVRPPQQQLERQQQQQQQQQQPMGDSRAYQQEMMLRAQMEEYRRFFPYTQPFHQPPAPTMPRGINPRHHGSLQQPPQQQQQQEQQPAPPPKQEYLFVEYRDYIKSQIASGQLASGNHNNFKFEYFNSGDGSAIIAKENQEQRFEFGRVALRNTSLEQEYSEELENPSVKEEDGGEEEEEVKTHSLYITDKSGGYSATLTNAYLLTDLKETSFSFDLLRRYKPVRTEGEGYDDGPDVQVAFSPNRVGGHVAHLVLEFEKRRIPETDSGKGLSFFSEQFCVVKKCLGYGYNKSDQHALNMMAQDFVPQPLRDMMVARPGVVYQTKEVEAYRNQCRVNKMGGIAQYTSEAMSERSLAVFKEVRTATKLKQNLQDEKIKEYVINYPQGWTTLLKMEEEKHKKDIESCDVHDAQLVERKSRHAKKNVQFVKIYVPGAVEGKPALNLEDIIHLRTGSKSHQGYAQALQTNWRDEHIIEIVGMVRTIELNGFITVEIPVVAMKPSIFERKWSVRFPHAEEVFEFMSSAIKKTSICFWPEQPTKGRQELKDNAISFMELTSWRQPNLNQEQKTAVAYFVTRPIDVIRLPPYIVHGPPGTGKTLTTIEAILHTYARSRDHRILVVAPSNAAADVICSRLADFIPDASQLHRFNWRKRNVASSLVQLLKYCAQDEQTDQFRYLDAKELGGKRIVVATCLACYLLATVVGLPKGHFSHLFVDEAAQALEPEIMVPVSLFMTDNVQLWMAGDPKQLGPTVRSPEAAAHGLDLSLQERLMALPIYNQEDPSVSIMLLNNYRSHTGILEVSSRLFYDNKLVPRADSEVVESLGNWSLLSTSACPLLMYGVRGVEKFEKSSYSLFNLTEATTIADLIENLLADDKLGVTPDQFGVIATYRRQTQSIRQILRSRSLGAVRVGCINDYQGQEAKITILSTVLSQGHFKTQKSESTPDPHGFLADPKRFNVAISRGKALTILVGNPDVLQRAPNWRYVLSKCIASGNYRGCEIPSEWYTAAGVMNPTNNEEEEGVIPDITALVKNCLWLGNENDVDGWMPSLDNLAAWYNEEQDFRVNI